MIRSPRIRASTPLVERTPIPLSPYLPTRAEKKGFSAFTTICFTVNYLIGSGFLTIPWAFQQGGVLLSSLGMTFVMVICNITKNYVLCAMARAQALEDHKLTSARDAAVEQGALITPPKDLRYGSIRDPREAVALHNSIEVESPSLNHTPRRRFFKRKGDGSKKLIIKNRKFEYTELCKIFLGDWGEKAYMTSVGIAVTLQLWGHGAVFGLGMAQALPLLEGGFDENYKLYVLLFGSIVIPLSCLELEEQVEFQILLSFCRFLVIFLMIQTVIFASAGESDAVYFKSHNASDNEGPKLFDLTGFYEMFSVLVYTAMFHNGIPVLAEPVGDRTKLSSIFLQSIFVVCGACWILGFVVASYFGDEIEQSSNLNWDTYVGGTGYKNEDGAWVDVAWWAVAISGFIVLFPVANVISAFPLNAIVLGNNYLIGACGASAETNRLAKIFFRCLASTPPIVGAFFVKELGIISSYAGVLAIVTVLTFPALLYLSSLKAMELAGKPNAVTYYDGFGSSTVGASLVLVISVVAAMYVLIKLILM